MQQQFPDSIEFTIHNFTYKISLSIDSHISLQVNDPANQQQYYLLTPCELQSQSISINQLYESIYYQYLHDYKLPNKMIVFDEQHVIFRFNFPKSRLKTVVIQKKKKEEREQKWRENSDDQYIEGKLLQFIKNPSFIKHIQDIIQSKVLRLIDYYKKLVEEIKQKMLMNFSKNIQAYLNDIFRSKSFELKVQQFIKSTQNKLQDSFSKLQVQLKLKNSVINQRISIMNQSLQQLYLKHNDIIPIVEGYQQFQQRFQGMQKCLDLLRLSFTRNQVKKKRKNNILIEQEINVQELKTIFDQNQIKDKNRQITRISSSPEKQKLIQL